MTGEVTPTTETVSHLSDREVFTQIWTKPRKVFRFIHQTGYTNYKILLLALAGISRAFDRASTQSTGDEVGLPFIILIAIFAGGGLGWITFHIYAALLRWTGKWLGGEGGTDDILTMIAYAMLPSIYAMVFLIPQIALFGNGIFQSDFDIYSHGIIGVVMFFVSVLAELSLGIWTMVLAVVGLSEVQQLSNGKAFLNLILPVLVIGLPLLLIIMLVSGV